MSSRTRPARRSFSGGGIRDLKVKYVNLLDSGSGAGMTILLFLQSLYKYTRYLLQIYFIPTL